jgi:hypothetical protein
MILGLEVGDLREDSCARVSNWEADSLRYSIVNDEVLFQIGVFLLLGLSGTGKCSSMVLAANQQPLP